MTVRIGTLTLAAPREFTNTYETASWFQRVLVPAGDYEVTANLDSPTGRSGSTVYWVHVTMPGTAVQSFFPSSFGGVMHGEGATDRWVGEPATARVSCVYGYQLAQAIAAGQPFLGGTVTLDPAWEVAEDDLNVTIRNIKRVEAPTPDQVQFALESARYLADHPGSEGW